MSNMRASVVGSLFGVVAIRCLVGCAGQTSAATQTPATAERDRAIAQEQRALDSGHLRLQTQVLSDLQRLREGRTSTSRAAEPSSEQSTKLLVFGGASHEVYLGCLCDGKNPESVFNLTGEYGSGLSGISLRNKSAPYGGKHQDTSACNAHATHPPRVVASDGKSLGLLTVNASLKKRIATPAVTDWLSRMCQR